MTTQPVPFDSALPRRSPRARKPVAAATALGHSLALVAMTLVGLAFPAEAQGERCYDYDAE